jgi:membrane-anchored mycosin MYCP
MRSTKRHGRKRRALALSVAAGVLAFSGPAMPAAAQTAGAPFWAPPPVNPGVDGSHAPLHPSGDFQQKQGCIQPSTAGTTVTQEPWAQQVLGIDQLHSEGWTGAGEKVAVIDTGINSHPLLPPVDGSGGSSVPGSGANSDCDGHGTIVAGVIAARRDPTSGFSGIAPDVSLMSLRQQSSVFQSQSQQGRTIGDTATLAEAINYAVDHGANVINISQASCQVLSQAQNDPVFNQELQTAVFNAYQSNVVVVAAAGNTGEGGCQQNPPGNPTTAVLPAWYSKYVLSVASVGQQGAPSAFSIAGPWVGVAAPGENITSLDPGVGGSGLANQIPQGTSGQNGPIQGTSFAAPYVAGLAALILQKFGQEGTHLTAQQVINRIEQTAQHPGGTNGRNDIVGFGLINPDAALNNVLPPQVPPPAGVRLSANAIPHRNIPALLVALGGTGIGVAAVIFTAFLTNAARHVRRRARANLETDRRQ